MANQQNTTNKPSGSFLEQLGLLSSGQASQNAHFDSLTWDEVVQFPFTGNSHKFGQVPNSKFEELEFNSYSGADTAIYLLYDSGDTRHNNQGLRNFLPFKEIQTLSVSSARSVHPVRRLGESHVVEYTRGARTIAGSIVCVSGPADPFLGQIISSHREQASDQPFFTDELPMFSMLVVASDEYGNVSHAAVSDVTLTNFGQTFSVDDLYLENTYTYVARYYHPLLPDPSILNRLNFKKTSRHKLSKEFLHVRGSPVWAAPQKNWIWSRQDQATEAFLNPFGIDDSGHTREWIKKEKLKSLPVSSTP